MNFFSILEASRARSSKLVLHDYSMTLELVHGRRWSWEKITEMTAPSCGSGMSLPFKFCQTPWPPGSTGFNYCAIKGMLNNLWCHAIVKVTVKDFRYTVLVDNCSPYRRQSFAPSLTSLFISYSDDGKSLPGRNQGQSYPATGRRTPRDKWCVSICLSRRNRCVCRVLRLRLEILQLVRRSR